MNIITKKIKLYKFNNYIIGMITESLNESKSMSSNSQLYRLLLN